MYNTINGYNSQHEALFDWWDELYGSFYCLGAKSRQGQWLGESFFTRDGWDRRVPRYLNDHYGDNVYFVPHGFEKPIRQARYAAPTPAFWADLDAVDPRGLEH